MEKKKGSEGKKKIKNEKYEAIKYKRKQKQKISVFIGLGLVSNFPPGCRRSDQVSRPAKLLIKNLKPSSSGFSRSTTDAQILGMSFCWIVSFVFFFIFQRDDYGSDEKGLRHDDRRKTRTGQTDENVIGLAKKRARGEGGGREGKEAGSRGVPAKKHWCVHT